MATFDYSAAKVTPTGNTDKDLAKVYAARQQNFENNYLPLLEDLSAQTDSRDLVQNATQQATQLTGNVQAMSQRTQSRYAGGLTPAQQAQLAQDQNRLSSLSAGSYINQARSLQAQQNTALRADLMNVTDSLINTGTANMAQFAANEQQRKQANAQAGKSFAGSMLSLGGAMVGSYFGPAGAQIGAGLGSMAGSYV